MAHIERIMREGTGADRQLMVWERTQDMKAVVDQIMAETNEGLTPPAEGHENQMRYVAQSPTHWK